MECLTEENFDNFLAHNIFTLTKPFFLVTCNAKPREQEREVLAEEIEDRLVLIKRSFSERNIGATERVI